MLNNRLEAADLVDGHLAQRLYNLQSDPLLYQKMWAELEKQAKQMNKRFDSRDSGI